MLILLALLPMAAVALQKYRAEQRLFFPARQAVGRSAQACALDGAIDVVFAARGAEVRGWYVPSRNGAAIILTHGAGGNRRSVVPEARALTAAGFGALLFDWPGHGDSGGSIHWNDGERASLSAAVDWLGARGDVTQGRLGAYGFSMGGYVVSQVASTDTRLRAVVLAGTPADQWEQIRFQHGAMWLLSELPALFALWRGGMQVGVRRPIDEVAKISPRAVLLIGGTNDPIVPIRMSHQLFERAGAPKDLLVLHGVGHGDYATAGGAVYLTALVAFFRQTLLARTD